MRSLHRYFSSRDSRRVPAFTALSVVLCRGGVGDGDWHTQGGVAVAERLFGADAEASAPGTAEADAEETIRLRALATAAALAGPEASEVHTCALLGGRGEGKGRVERGEGEKDPSYCAPCHSTLSAPLHPPLRGLLGSSHCIPTLPPAVFSPPRQGLEYLRGLASTLAPTTAVMRPAALRRLCVLTAAAGALAGEVAFPAVSSVAPAPDWLPASDAVDRTLVVLKGCSPDDERSAGQLPSGLFGHLRRSRAAQVARGRARQLHHGQLKLRVLSGASGKG